MNRDLRFTFLLFLFSVLFRFASQAQFYPIQSSVVVQGPYTPYLRDYIEGEKLSVSLMLSDPALSFVDAKLQITLKGVGVEIKTNPSSSFASIHLTYGTPVVLSSADLSSYFLSSNLLLKGMTVKEYEQKGMLAEGLYELKIEVIEVTRSKAIGSASATFWAMLQDPPLLTFPVLNAQLEASNPISLLFQWQAMHKMYTAFEVNYVLEIYEVRATDARPINEVVRTSIPVFQTTTTQTSYTYGPSDPVLQTGMKYLWRVQAKANASQQNEVFKNNGYSQVSSFEWLSICKPPFNLQVKTNPQGMAYVSFDQGEGAISYKVRIRSMSPITEWIEMETLTPSILLNQLALNRPYEVQVASTCDKRISNYSPSVSFTILSDTKTTTNPSKEPLPKLIIDTSTYLDPLEAGPDKEIKVNYYKMRIKTISYDPMTKLYSGTGKVYHPEFGIWISVEFRNIQINQEKVFVVGIIQMVSKQPTANQLAQVPNRKQPMICAIEDESTQSNGSVGGTISSAGNTSGGNTNPSGQTNTNGTVAAGTGGNSNTSSGTTGNTTAQNGTSGSNNTQTGTNTTNTNQNGNGPLSSTPQADGSDSTKTATVNPSLTQFAVDQNQIYGFDDSDPKTIWKSIEQMKEDKVIYNVKPASIYPRINFKSADLSVFSVDPLKAISANQSLKLKSNGWADTTHLEVKLDSMKGKSIDKLNVVVYPKKVKNLKILILHEENDDVQVVAVEDKVAANAVCIKKGANQFLDSKYNWVNGVYNQQGDDTLNIDGNIIVGKNGICETQALNKPLKTASIDIAQLRDVLNNQIYNQAALEWNIDEIKEITVNWDLNRNQKFEIYEYGSNYELTPGEEFLALKKYIIENKSFANQSKDYYYIILTDHSDAYISNNKFIDPYGLNMDIPNKEYAYVFGNKSPEKLRTIGHELGHSAFGFFDDTYLNKQPLNLMNHVSTSNYLKRIFLIKEQWDIIQGIKNTKK